MAKKAYIGVDGVARKIKKFYVGVETELPIYDTQTVTETLTATTITDCFEVTNGDYYFKGSGKVFTTNNGGVNNSEATTTLTAKYDISSLTFKYSYSTEADYDNFTLVVAGATVEDKVSGETTTKTWNGSLTAGQEVSFLYTKDQSQAGNNDKCTFYNVTVTYAKRVVIGYESKGVARKVRKAYIGIGGVARPCWNGGELTYYGTVTALGVKRNGLAATAVGDYALFGGGRNSANTELNNVDAYNSSLTRKSATNLSLGRVLLAATTVGGYALFGGGGQNNSINSLDNVDAYNSSLTRKSATNLSLGKASLAATTVGNYALFGGGLGIDHASVDAVDAYNTALTRSIPTALNSPASELAATTVGNYALFGGGCCTYTNNNHVYLNTVTVYDSSLTKSTASNLATKREYLAATTVGNYALFAGGQAQGSSVMEYYTKTDAYNASLTKVTVSALSKKRSYLSATTVDDFAIFAGGYAGDSSTRFANVDVYDASLTKVKMSNLSEARDELAAVAVGGYALFGGGHSGNDYSTTVDAYKVV